MMETARQGVIVIMARGVGRGSDALLLRVMESGSRESGGGADGICALGLGLWGYGAGVVGLWGAGELEGELDGEGEAG